MGRVINLCTEIETKHLPKYPGAHVPMGVPECVSRGVIVSQWNTIVVAVTKIA